MSTVSLLQDSSNVYSASTLTFKFFAGWAQLDPSLGKSAGGTPIVVIGAGFNSTASFLCKFSSSYRNSSSKAVFITHTNISCRSPPWPVRPNQSTATFSLLENGGTIPHNGAAAGVEFGFETGFWTTAKPTSALVSGAQAITVSGSGKESVSNIDVQDQV